MTKKILLTSFEPFGGMEKNISQQVAGCLPSTLGGVDIVKEILPVSFRGAPAMLRKFFVRHQADVILMLGQCGEGKSLRLERFAHNLMDAKGADNDGYCPHEEPISESLPLCLQTSLPVKKLVEILDGKAVQSTSAGLYVCNRLYYEALLMNEKSLFVHIPRNAGIDEAVNTVRNIMERIIDGEMTGSF